MKRSRHDASSRAKRHETNDSPKEGETMQGRGSRPRGPHGRLSGFSYPLVGSIGPAPGHGAPDDARELPYILTDPISTNVMDYQNGGQNRTVGAELMASYSRSRFTADFNFSWIKVLKSNPYNVTITGFAQQPGIDRNRNTPVAMANAVLAWEVSQRLKFTSHINFKSKQETYNADIVKIAQANKEMEEASKYPAGDPEWIRHMQQATTYISQAIYKGDMDPRVIVDLGAEYKLNKLTFGLNVHNLFNTKYNQSGSNTKLIPQKGLWFMASVAYKF